MKQFLNLQQVHQLDLWAFSNTFFGETLATALIGILVAKYGWLASNMVLYTASALAFILLVYIFIAERRAEKIADSDKKN